MASHARPSAPALRPLTLALAIPLAFAATASAQNAPTARLGEVVVSASGFEQDIRAAPASISVISRDELETKQFRDLAEALRDVEGIDVRGSTGKTGGLDISIRGMPSEYTLILIDGRRQNVAGDVTPNGFSDALTSFIPPLSAIERIEVIRGPMSTLYGSDAMGGVINIITRRVANEWGGSVGLETSLPENSDEGASQRLNLYANGPLVEDRLGIALRGSIFRRGESELKPSSGEGTISNRGPSPVETRQHTIGTRLTLTPNRQHDLWLDLDQARTAYDNDECQLGTLDYGNRACEPGVTSDEVWGYEDTLRFNRDQVAIGHTSRFELGTLESSLMRNVTETIGRTIPTAARPDGDPSVGDERKLKTTNTVFDTKLVAPLGESHLATVGAQWWDAKLEDGLLYNTHTQTMWSLFGEDEWQLTESLVATLGLRYDRHDAFGGQFSPRAYLVWNTSEHWTLKGGMSQGFKAPRLNQLIDGVSGISGQGTNISIGNPDLKPETSTSTEIAAVYDNLAGFSASATAFHNKIDDKIGSGGDCTVNAISSCAANPSATYAINIDEAETWGLELNSRIQLAPRWSLNMNYTWTDSKLTQAGQRGGKLGDTPEHMANAMLRWDATDKASYWLRAEYRGKSRRFDGDPRDLTGNDRLEYAALGDIKAYTLFHLGAQYKATPEVTLNASINNVLDKDFRTYKSWSNVDGDTVWGSPYIQSSRSTKGFLPTGRTLWVSANVSF